VVSEHDVLVVIANTHDMLLHAGNNETYSSINEKNHGINRREVKSLNLLRSIYIDIQCRLLNCGWLQTQKRRAFRYYLLLY